MTARIVFMLASLSMVGAGVGLGASAGLAGPVTSAPDLAHGKSVAQKLCSNCHLVSSEQAHANVDVPSFREIANMLGQTEGSIMARIIIPKHPMPVIPLTKRELEDISAYIMSLRHTNSS